MTLNALLFLAAGIAFALYGPLMIDLYAVLEIIGGTGGMYWYVASFARMFGASLFGLGLLIWSITPFVKERAGTPETRRRLVLALLLANGMGLFVAVLQQVTIWANIAGWVTIIVYLLMLAGYFFFLVARRDTI
jgi:Ca2+/Na+ antiporter